MDHFIGYFRKWSYKYDLDLSDPHDRAEAEKAAAALKRQTCGERSARLIKKYPKLFGVNNGVDRAL